MYRETLWGLYLANAGLPFPFLMLGDSSVFAGVLVAALALAPQLLHQLVLGHRVVVLQLELVVSDGEVCDRSVAAAFHCCQIIS